MSRPLSESEYQERHNLCETEIDKVVAWLRYDAEQRVVNRSWGRVQVEIDWEDGVIKTIRINDGHIIKCGKNGRLPSKDGNGHAESLDGSAR